MDLFVGFAGDCADSIPDVIADITNRLQRRRGHRKPREPAGCRLHRFRSIDHLQRYWFPTNNQTNVGSPHRRVNTIPTDLITSSRRQRYRKVDYKLNEGNSISGMYFF